MRILALAVVSCRYVVLQNRYKFFSEIPPIHPLKLAGFGHEMPWLTEKIRQV